MVCGEVSQFEGAKGHRCFIEQIVSVVVLAIVCEQLRSL